MAKRKTASGVPWLTVGAAGAVIVAIAVTVFMVRPKPTLAPTTNTADPSAVTITTDDGIQLAATVKYPVRDSLSPAVILLHQYGQDRHQWDPYLQSFLTAGAGIAVLSYDMRGFGDSRIANIPASQEEHLDSLPKDLPAVIAYLKRQPSIDPEKISVIGASIGADVAFVGIGSNLGLYRAALLSPVVRGTALDGHQVSGFAPAGVYGLSDDKEQSDLKTFMAKVGDLKQETIVPGGGHGVELLTAAGVLDGIIAWISR